MKEAKQWKDHLLKSGVPFEYEIKKILEDKGCIVDFEFSYLRQNEDNKLKEFSFDLDAAYIKSPFFFELLVECKYRHESTQWVFLPDNYGGPKEIEYLDFAHLNEVFNAKKYPLKNSFPYPIGKLCNKGIEITSEGSNPKSIDQAISQLAFGVANKIAEQYNHHIDEVLKQNFLGTVFSTIPIIVTTARLFRINETVGIDEIKGSKEIAEIATEESCIVLSIKKTIELINYNRSVFQEFFSDKKAEQLKPILDNQNNMSFFLELTSSQNPACILVLNYNKLVNGFETVFQYLDKVVNPDEEVMSMIRDKIDRQKKLFERIKSRKNTR
jgi:hypothetical protein